MFLNKLLPNTRHVLSRAALPVKTGKELVRQRHTRAVPPRSELGTGEQIAMGALIFATIWFVPYWVLYHVPDYQHEDRHQYTGK